MEPWSYELKGRLEEHWIDSAALVGNPLGDPSRRPLWVYLPPGYDADAARRLPAIYVIQGLTGQIDMWKNRSAFRKSPIELTDALFSDPNVPPCVVVWVDCWTSIGGSQYVDSPATGRYHTYLCEEIVPWVDARYRTRAHRDHRAITGKSSGGYGAMITPMLRPDVFGAFATHAGDALFEMCYLPEFPRTVRALRDHHGGSMDAFWADFRSRVANTKPADMDILNLYCMAACYSADADGAVHLPVDDTGKLVPAVWERWLAWDPVRMVPRYADAMRSMRAIYIDAGNRDEWFLDLGAEAFRRALAEIGVTDVFFELFDATHKMIEYRYPIAMRYLAERIG
jgi:S-formylglutathione hydrolase FrmB